LYFRNKTLKILNLQKCGSSMILHSCGCRKRTGVATEGIRHICSYERRRKAVHCGGNPHAKSELTGVADQFTYHRVKHLRQIGFVGNYVIDIFELCKFKSWWSPRDMCLVSRYVLMALFQHVLVLSWFCQAFYLVLDSRLMLPNQWQWILSGHHANSMKSYVNPPVWVRGVCCVPE